MQPSVLNYADCETDTHSKPKHIHTQIHSNLACFCHLIGNERLLAVPGLGLYVRVKKRPRHLLTGII